jgi:hypothetical protein
MPANRPLCESHSGAETIASRTEVSLRRSVDWARLGQPWIADKAGQAHSFVLKY